MKKTVVEIIWATGLHARPAGEVVKLSNSFKSNIFFANDEGEVDAKSILGVLTLGACHKSKISIRIEGSDEEEALKALESFFKKEF